MAKRLTAKQIRYFGTPAQKAALKRKRKAAAKSSHRKRSNPSKKASYAKKKPSSKSHYAPKKGKRSNPGEEIIVFGMGNPARKKGKAMAKSAKYKKKAASKKNAGAHHHKSKKMTYTKRRKNVGGGALPRPMEWAKLGVGGVGGGVLTRVLPQFAGSANTGWAGYAMNIGAMLALTIGAHMLTKDKFITIGVATGGAIATLLRIVGDNTQYGSALALSGFGDYMVSNWVTPQRIGDPRTAIWENGQVGVTAAPQSGMLMSSGSDAVTDGNAF